MVSRAPASHELAEQLNQAVRCIRQCENLREIAAALSSSTASFCQMAAVFSIAGQTVRSERIWGLDGSAPSAVIEFPLAEAAAFRTAVDSQDPVIAMSSPGELSRTVSEALGRPSDHCVWLLPMVVRNRTVALLYAAGVAQTAPLELLAQAAALRLESLSTRATPANLVAISPGSLV